MNVIEKPSVMMVRHIIEVEQNGEVGTLALHPVNGGAYFQVAGRFHNQDGHPFSIRGVIEAGQYLTYQLEPEFDPADPFEGLA